MVPWETRSGSVLMRMLILFFIIFWSPLLSHFWSILGAGWGPKIDPKSTCGPTKCSGYRFLSDLYGMLRLARVLDWIWGRFLMKNRCFFHRFFSQLVSFFSTWRPSRNIAIYISGATFSFFQFFIFRRKNVKKREKNTTQEKTPKMTPGRTPNGPHF